MPHLTIKGGQSTWPMKKVLTLCLTATISVIQPPISSSQDLSQTLSYLENLCNQNGLSKGSYIFTELYSKVKIEETTYVPAFYKECKSLLICDIKKFKKFELKQYIGAVGDSCYQVRILMEKNSLDYSNTCFADLNGQKKEWSFQFLNKTASDRFQKAFLQLKKIIDAKDPPSKAPFDKN